MKAPLPVDEEERLDALHEYEILDTLPEQVFDKPGLTSEEAAVAVLQKG